MREKLRPLFLPVYFAIAFSTLAGGLFSVLFDIYAQTEFSSIAEFLEENRETIEYFMLAEDIDIDKLSELPAEREIITEYYERGRDFEVLLERELLYQFRHYETGMGLGNKILLQWLAIIIWLLPVYNHKRGKAILPKKLESRVINLSALVIFLPWIVGGIDLLLRIISQLQEVGAVDGRTYSVYIASYLLFASIVSHFNLALSQRTVVDHVADSAFQGEQRYTLKKGYVVTITARVTGLVLSLASIPLLVNIAIPFIFNGWLYFELAGMDPPDFIGIAQIFGPAVIGIIANLYFIIAQIAALISFRVSVQEPIDRLIIHMQAVAKGDFSSRASVLKADEIGALRGHFNQMVDGLEERERIRNVFGKYVSTEIVEKLMEKSDIDLEGEEIETTVMFVDIRGFTGLSEYYSPRELVEFLNEYFSYIVKPIIENHGVINKFMGDSVMAVFSPVFGVEDHPHAAVKAALGMRRALNDFNKTGRFRPVRHGIGIHTGMLIAGNVGTSERKEYTVIGDTVNVASRIESQTKIEETDILVSEETVKKLQNPREFNLIKGNTVTMRGKSSQISLYTSQGDGSPDR